MSRTKPTFRVRRKRYHQQEDRGGTEAKRHLDSENQGKKESTEALKIVKRSTRIRTDETPLFPNRV